MATGSSPPEGMLRLLISIPNQEDHGFYPWVNWSSNTGCSPLVDVSWEPQALPMGLHRITSWVSFVFHSR
jgi:hypothetical protein